MWATGGKMSPRTYTPASGSLLDSRHDSSLSEAVGPLRGLMVLALAVLLSPMGQAELFAQQAPDQGQYPSNQQLPDQQSGYGQPGYAQPQSEGQPAYPPQSYPPQSYPAPGQMSRRRGGAGLGPLGPKNLQQLAAPTPLFRNPLGAGVRPAATSPAGGGE